MQPAANRPAAAPVRAALRNVTKRFGASTALQGVSLEGRGGSIHAVTGENGAGKSTLMKLLAGVHRPDEGQIWLRGLPVRLANPAQARRAGVSTVFQELTVLPHLSVAETLCLGREPLRHGTLDRAGMALAATELLDQLGIDLPPSRAVGGLSIAERQLLEIAKGLAAQAEVFIFDEPTAPLNRTEIDQLEGLLRRLAAAGSLVFYISHRLDEIFRFCDTITVLKDGQLVTTQAATELTPGRLVSLMVGRELQSLFPPRSSQAMPSSVALDVKDFVAAPGQPPLSLSLHAGEIVGIAGLEGQGQREIVRGLAGLSEGGPGPAAAVRDGIALLPEDRKAEGLYLDLPVQDNIWLGGLRKRALWQRAPRDAGVVRALAERLQLRAAPATPVGQLSGGNQQKVMLGRWLAAGMRVLLVEQPTRGVDVGAKAEIYRLLREFTEAGGAVLAVSGDLPELLGLCDRILVVRGGAVVAEMAAASATEESLLALALGHARHEETMP